MFKEIGNAYSGSEKSIFCPAADPREAPLPSWRESRPLAPASVRLL